MHNFEKVMEQFEIGFARHKLIYDELGKTVDYCFLAVNTAFEKITGLKRQKLLNRRMTEVIPNIIQDDFDWIGFYGKIVAEKEKSIFEQYSAAMDKWYRVECFSSEEDCFTTLFTDITHERELVNASKEFLEDGQTCNTYEQMAQRMKRITGADYVVLNIFLEDSIKFRMAALAGVSNVLQKASQILGLNPMGKEWEIDPVRFEIFKEKTVTEFNHLHELTEHALSNTAVRILEKALNLGKIAVIKSSQGDRFLGAFTLIFSKGKQLQNKNEAIIYADMVAMLLEKRSRQQELEKNKKQLQENKQWLDTIISNSPTVISVSYTHLRAHET